MFISQKQRDIGLEIKPILETSKINCIDPVSMSSYLSVYFTDYCIFYVALLVCRIHAQQPAPTCILTLDFSCGYQVIYKDY